MLFFVPKNVREKEMKWEKKSLRQMIILLVQVASSGSASVDNIHFVKAKANEFVFYTVERKGKKLNFLQTYVLDTYVRKWISITWANGNG